MSSVLLPFVLLEVLKEKKIHKIRAFMQMIPENVTMWSYGWSLLFQLFSFYSLSDLYAILVWPRAFKHIASDHLTNNQLAMNKEGIVVKLWMNDPILNTDNISNQSSSGLPDILSSTCSYSNKEGRFHKRWNQ